VVLAAAAVFVIAGVVIASIAFLGEDSSDPESSVCFASSDADSPFVQVRIRVPKVPCDSPRAQYRAVGDPQPADTGSPDPQCPEGQTAFLSVDGWYCAKPLVPDR
jgi:hypothetical protein